MADTGWKTAGTAGSYVNGSGSVWNSPSLATADDNSPAWSGLPKNLYSYYLRLTNFGFSIPSGSTIDGIWVRIKRYASHVDSIDDGIVQLRDTGGPTGDNKARIATGFPHWPTSYETVYYGGSTDDWNVSGLDTDLVNDSSFGIDVVADSDIASSRTAYIDVVEIRVYYTEPDTGPVCFGHSTGVEEDYTETMAANSTGTGVVTGSGDAEKLLIHTSQTREFGPWKLGAGLAKLIMDKYGSGTGGLSLEYKSGATESACEADTWHNYTGQFTQDGWIKIRVKE